VSKKPDPAQLWLELDNAIVAFKEAADKVQKLSRDVRRHESCSRETFRRKVNHLAAAKFGDNFRKAYTAVYAQLYQDTGWHPVMELEGKDDVLLDLVESHNHLADAFEAANKVLIRT
jgi:hypothetical protein